MGFPIRPKIPKIQDSRTANIEGESSDLADHFVLLCLVPVILCAPGNKLGDNVTMEIIGHVPQKNANGDGRLIGTSFVDHIVRVVMKYLLLEGV